MDNLQKLKKQYNEAHAKMREASKKIKEIELAQKMPELKKKYEGKYFKYKNSYGKGQNWFIYSYCEKVLNNIDFQGKIFETNLLEESNFKSGCNELRFFMFQTEITKEEYLVEFEKFKDRFNQMFLK